MPPPPFYFLAKNRFGFRKKGKIYIFETIILNETPAFSLTPTVDFNPLPKNTPPAVIGQVTHVFKSLTL